ncbi:hypothetical protein TRVL_08379 [Trypanosoma vivax]|nr:hypothetical protein TRVL_08379 [Trypanosoma vivax]
MATSSARCIETKQRGDGTHIHVVRIRLPQGCAVKKPISIKGRAASSSLPDTPSEKAKAVYFICTRCFACFALQLRDLCVQHHTSGICPLNAEAIGICSIHCALANVTFRWSYWCKRTQKHGATWLCTRNVGVPELLEKLLAVVAPSQRRRSCR